MQKLLNTSWEETTYDNAWDYTLASLIHRQEIDKSFTVEEAKNIINSLYVQDGNDQYGRGAVQDIVMQATLDAYEYFINKNK